MAKLTAKKADVNSLQGELFHEIKRDLNPFWSSSLFSDVYLKNDLPREYKALWENDEIGSYYNFYQGFVDLCHDLEGESFQNWREADTVKNWIVPVMSLLGWENNSERHQNSYVDNTSFTIDENGRKQVYRPDLLYFDKPQHKTYTQKEKNAEDRIREIRDKKTGAKIIVEAKYWDRLSLKTDKFKNKDSEDSASSLGPELQTLKYMELFDQDFGILTDGKTWKLFHKELSKGMIRRTFEFDLGPLMELALDLKSLNNEQKFRNYSKYFYYFFAKESFIRAENAKTTPLAYEVLEYSKKYASSIEEDLKKRFIITMDVTCNALKRSAINNRESFDLNILRNVSESHLFTILFIKSCEVRNVLPIKSPNYVKISLHEVIESLSEMSYDPDKHEDDYLRDFRYGTTFGGKKFEYEGYDIFNRFINLYEIIHDGTSSAKDFGFEIAGFKESIFTKEEWAFAKKNKITNREMIRILFNLNFIESKSTQRKYQQIPYSYFSPRQLGSIYESFLEYKLEKAETDMIFTKGQWVTANLKSKTVKDLKLVDNHTVEKGNLYFSPNNSDRKMTGSYYTPDYVVRDIIEKTIGVISKDLKSNEILKLKVCDPAMGSGHFLAGAIEFLVECYREKWSQENNDDLEESYYETARNILDACIFGHDLNPRAVKLAKMSLWLMTAFAGKKLEKLDDQLFVCNSLESFKTSKYLKPNYYDAVIGNPPYLDYRDVDTSVLKDFEAFTSTKDVEKPNLYVPFVERSLQMVKQNGKFGLIFPIHWLSTENAKSLRSLVLKNYQINEIADLSDLNIFPGAATYPNIVVITKTASNTDLIHIRKIKSDLSVYESTLSLKEVLLANNFEINIQNTGDVKKVLDKINSQNHSLDDYAKNFKWGTSKTGYGKLKVKANELTEKTKKQYLRMIQTSDIKKFKIQYGGDHIPMNIYTQKLMNEFLLNKVVIARVTKTIQSCFDTSGYALGKASFFTCKNDKEMKATVLLLNSYVVNFWMHSTFSNLHMQGGYIRFDIPYLKRIPFPDLQKHATELAKLHDQVVKKQITFNEANEYIFKIYNISSQEMKYIKTYFEEKNLISEFEKNYENKKIAA